MTLISEGKAGIILQGECSQMVAGGAALREPWCACGHQLIKRLITAREQKKNNKQKSCLPGEFAQLIVL